MTGFLSLIRALAALCLLIPFAPARADDFPLAEVAPGVFVHSGRIEERSAANMGDQANIGFIVGGTCVAVIDTGGSNIIGQRLKAAIARRTPLPVCYVINTHVHPDHVFGNVAFVDDAVTFVGHERLPKAMALRAQNFARSLVRDLGEAAAPSKMIPPRLLVKDELTLDLGERVLRLRAYPVGHSDADISVHDVNTDTLWLSDLLFMDHTPAIDGSVLGWLAVTDALKPLKVARVVPGHGPASALWPQSLAPQEAYLRLIVDEVRTALKKRRTIEQAVDEVGLSEQGKWREFDNFHRRNVTTSYVELEWED